MDIDDLLEFIKRIAECKDPIRIKWSMEQLVEIMERCQVDEELVTSVKTLSDKLPEIYELTKLEKMRKDDLLIAVRRAQERIANERRNYGRC